MRAHIRFHGGTARRRVWRVVVKLPWALSGVKECRRVSGQRGKRMLDQRMKGA